MDNGKMNYERYLDGDDDGLRKLIDEFYKPLTLYLNTYLRNMDDAEEEAENTFVALAIKRPVFYGRSGFKTWLFSIGRNLAVDRLRSKPKNAHLSIDECYDLPSGEYVEDAYLLTEDKEAVRKAMERLKPKYRQVLHLVYFEDMDCNEIAQVTGKSRTGVYHLLERAKASLKKELEKEGY